jgi:hypothetical protein
MSFDKEIRNMLAKTVVSCRRKLTEDITGQLRSVFGLHPDGTQLPLDQLAHLTRDQLSTARVLRELLEHHAAGAAGSERERKCAAYERVVLEISFTVLNRLAALRLCEERGLVIECVRKGAASDGFRLFERVSGGALGTRYDTYLVFLGCVFDEAALDLGVLFDRYIPQSAVFPTERCLADVLSELNKPELTELWKEDETIGWIYQYFNPQEERRAMREASQAPRNSRELAVRNQFFTPRYVVEFLTDNTLGRTWYEMQQGKTALVDECRYLVRRPDEVFFTEVDSPRVENAQKWLSGADLEEPDLWELAHTVNGYLHAGSPGEGAREWLSERLHRLTSETAASLTTQELLDMLFLICRWERFSDGFIKEQEHQINCILEELRLRVNRAKAEDLSQEELLKLPVFVPYRAKKDPRDIKILDPACGSGHFLLYAFDLLERIYREAWEDPDSPASETTGQTLREDYETLDELLRAVPELIIRWNLYGIDIDHRAVQIAALALWLRAQKSWQRMGLKAPERPRIVKSNIVTAEPMPGDKEMLREFTADLQPKVLGQIVETIFEKMKLAGEAGSLLKIEEEISEAIAEAKKQWLEGPKQEQQQLFPDAPKPKQQVIRYDVMDVSDEDFWQQAEERILKALRDYAEESQNISSAKRRLFAEDTARGFAFIDLRRKRYDVILMNPPFGECSLRARRYTSDQYPISKADIYAMFVDCGVQLLCDKGYIGAITSRASLFSTLLNKWRVNNFLTRYRLLCLADLGHGVLDNALVEAASYIIQKDSKRRELWAINALSSKDKGLYMLKVIKGYRFNIVMHNSLLLLPGNPITYWLQTSVLTKLINHPPLSDHIGKARVGLQTDDDFRFFRLAWEVLQSDIRSTWKYISKGGEYEPYYDDIHLLVNWSEEASELRAFIEKRYSWSKRASSAEYYGKPGLTYPGRTTSEFSPRPLPKDTIFTIAGPAILPYTLDDGLAFLALSYTRIFRISLEMFIGGGDAVNSGSAARTYSPGTLDTIPLPILNKETRDILSKLAKECLSLRITEWMFNETSRYFTSPFPSLQETTTLTNMINRLLCDYEKRLVEIEALSYRIEQIANALYGLHDMDMPFIDAEYGQHSFTLNDEPTTNEVIELINLSLDKLVDKTARIRGFSRQTTKKSYWTDRRYECVALICNSNLSSICRIRKVAGEIPNWFKQTITKNIISYYLGCVFGRWDCRAGIDSNITHTMPNVFDPLPVCPPGMLVGPDGLPAKPGQIVSEEWLQARPDAATLPPDGSVKNPTIPDEEYPIRISWDGILVDDPGFNGGQPHRDDIVRRVREVLELLWGDRAQAIEEEACEILGVSELREYFRKPSGFFQVHLKRYSKSRRKAPIYWPLSTASGSYTVWLYYHRLNDQTLYAAVNKYIDPKIAEVERAMGRLESELAEGAGRGAASLRDRLNEGRALLGELQELREELLRVAGLPYKPNLNDGVIITAAPLHKLFRLRSWAKDTKSCWEKLGRGDYDWAHLAYTLWPERVKEVCRRDRSIAIAHGLEDLCEIKPSVAKRKGGRRRTKEEGVR